MVEPKFPFSFDKVDVPPSMALLYPAHKNNNHTRVGLGQVCATGMLAIFEFSFCKLLFLFAHKISEISNQNLCCRWKVPKVDGCTLYRYFELKTCTLLEAAF